MVTVGVDVIGGVVTGGVVTGGVAVLAVEAVVETTLVPVAVLGSCTCADNVEVAAGAALRLLLRIMAAATPPPARTMTRPTRAAISPRCERFGGADGGGEDAGGGGGVCTRVGLGRAANGEVVASKAALAASWGGGGSATLTKYDPHARQKRLSAGLT